MIFIEFCSRRSLRRSYRYHAVVKYKIAAFFAIVEFNSTIGIVLIVSNFCLWTQPFYNFLSFFSYELMLQCWNKEPSQRPKFSDIVIWMEKSSQRV